MLNFHAFVIQMPNIDSKGDVKLQHLHYLINLLLPFVKNIREEQEVEIVVEAGACEGNQLTASIKKIISTGLCFVLMAFLLKCFYFHNSQSVHFCSSAPSNV